MGSEMCIRDRVTAVSICLQSGDGTVLQEIRCDAVAMSGGWSPVVHLWSHCGGKLWWDEERAMFRPDPDQPPRGADGKGFVITAGMASGALTTAEVLDDAAEAAGSDAPPCESSPEAPILPVWMMPEGADYALRSKMWLDYQNDVKVSDVRLAAQEGFESVEHAKRYTTLGMATDQGKLSNINGLAILADRLDALFRRLEPRRFVRLIRRRQSGLWQAKHAGLFSNRCAAHRSTIGTRPTVRFGNPSANGVAHIAFRRAVKPMRKPSRAR